MAYSIPFGSERGLPIHILEEIAFQLVISSEDEQLNTAASSLLPLLLTSKSIYAALSAGAAVSLENGELYPLQTELYKRLSFTYLDSAALLRRSKSSAAWSHSRQRASGSPGPTGNGDSTALLLPTTAALTAQFIYVVRTLQFFKQSMREMDAPFPSSPTNTDHPRSTSSLPSPSTSIPSSPTIKPGIYAIYNPSLVSHLYMCFMLMLEDDGLNRFQLQRVCVPRFVELVVLKRLWEGTPRGGPPPADGVGSASSTVDSNNSNGWPAENTLNTLSLWLLWLFSTEDSVRAETAKRREMLVNYVLPFVLNPYRYASALVPPTHYTIPLPATVRNQTLTSNQTAHGSYPIYRSVPQDELGRPDERGEDEAQDEAPAEVPIERMPGALQPKDQQESSPSAASASTSSSPNLAYHDNSKTPIRDQRNSRLTQGEDRNLTNVDFERIQLQSCGTSLDAWSWCQQQSRIVSESRSPTSAHNVISAHNHTRHSPISYAYLPPITAAAKLIFMSRREAVPLPDPSTLPLPINRAAARAAGWTMAGPTQEDIRELGKWKATRLAVVDGNPSESSAQSPNFDLFRESPSTRWDMDWNRMQLPMQLFSNPRSAIGRRVYKRGTLTGLWQGLMQIPNDSALGYIQRTRTLPTNFSEASLGLTMRPVYMRLEEHEFKPKRQPRYASRAHAKSKEKTDGNDAKPIGVGVSRPGVHAQGQSRPATGPDGGSSSNAPPAYVDENMNNAWIPGPVGSLRWEKLDPNEQSRAIAGFGSAPKHGSERKRQVSFTVPRPDLEVQGGNSNATTATTATSTHVYETFDPERHQDDDDDEDGGDEDNVDRLADSDSDSWSVRDTILTGTMDDKHAAAWGSFVYYGRVRPWDGLVALLRVGTSPENANSKFLFYGYIYSGQTLVGNWRYASGDANAPAMESSFMMSKRGD